MQNHVGALSTFPTGGDGYNPRIQNYVTGGKPNGPDKMGLGWGYQILPYLEQNALKGMTTMGRLASAEISLYFCPSRRANGKSTEFSDVVGGIELPYLMTDYAAPHPATYLVAAVPMKPVGWGDAAINVTLQPDH